MYDQFLSADQALFGCLDGHGPNGEQATYTNSESHAGQHSDESNMRATLICEIDLRSGRFCHVP